MSKLGRCPVRMHRSSPRARSRDDVPQLRQVPGREAAMSFPHKPWWWVAGLLAVVLGAAAGIVIAGGTSDMGGPDAGAISGDCNAQGARNTVNCNVLPPPRSIGKVSLSQHLNPSGTLVFAGPADEL